MSPRKVQIIACDAGGTMTDTIVVDHEYPNPLVARRMVKGVAGRIDMCGHRFGDWRQNWKLRALILARDDDASLQEIYPGIRKPDPDLCEVREFICPGCGALLEVEVVPVGYPILFDSLPDIDAFYRDWLEEPLPDPLTYADLSSEITSEWAAAHPLTKRKSA